jgi:UPF0755 protein
MAILRFILRFIFFLVGMAAIVAMIAVAFSFYRVSSERSTIVIAEGVPSIGRAPEDVDDVILSLVLQSRSDEINTPLSNDPSPLPFIIEPGESALSVGARLQDMNLITDAELFRRYLSYNGLDVSIEAGDYDLRRNMSMVEIAEALQDAKFEEVVITIPEGLRVEEIAQKLTEEGIMDGAIFLETVRRGSGVEHSLLSDRPAGATYEGYLFPDTYRLEVNSRPEDLIERMLDNLAAKLPANTFDLATRHGLNLYEVMTLASIVEREAVHNEERPVIASVYLNRLKPESLEPYLRADPTVQYAMGYQPDADQWWKTPVTLEEYANVDNPYNTYLYPGLPPGPIANAGINSIVAVLEPAQTNYLYFVAFDNGFHVFAETFAEHQQNVNQAQGQ